MITVNGLTKKYGTTTVVDDVSFRCEPGSITGFLGPNGAGKSTTLRMVTGLTRPDAGTATINGRAYADLPNPSLTVGTLLDSSAMHTGRTGRSTLRLAARMAGVRLERVDEALSTVGLSEHAADRRVGDYSLGMRQRLGIAQALIGEPQLLVLDEPANGLDPEGIAWMRGLLRDFADRGGTVLLSSHLLAEVEATVDRLVVIGGGRVVAAGSLDELLTTSGIVVRATDMHALAAALGAAGVDHTSRDDGALAVPEASAEDVARIAVAAGVLVVELRPSERGGLEHLFFSLTGGVSHDAAPLDTLQDVA